MAATAICRGWPRKKAAKIRLAAQKMRLKFDLRHFSVCMKALEIIFKIGPKKLGFDLSRVFVHFSVLTKSFSSSCAVGYASAIFWSSSTAVDTMPCRRLHRRLDTMMGTQGIVGKRTCYLHRSRSTCMTGSMCRDCCKLERSGLYPNDLEIGKKSWKF